MDPNVWGPKLWFVMHTISLNYPKSKNGRQTGCLSIFSKLTKCNTM